LIPIVHNNGTTDSASLLDSYWHYDHTSPVAAGQNDFYSVALHELLHSIGFGSSDNLDGTGLRDDLDGSARSSTEWR
jgi:hypothetical protein